MRIGLFVWCQLRSVSCHRSWSVLLPGFQALLSKGGVCSREDVRICSCAIDSTARSSFVLGGLLSFSFLSFFLLCCSSLAIESAGCSSCVRDMVDYRRDGALRMFSSWMHKVRWSRDVVRRRR